MKKYWLPAIIGGLILGTVVSLSARLLYLTTPPPPTGYADIIEPLLPFTVSIFTNRSEAPESQRLREDPVLAPFLTTEDARISLGSGIIISRDGLVVTNAHVIQSAEDIIVVTHQGLSTGVEQLWIDPETDIALLKTALQVNADLPVSDLTDSRVGDLVFTVGNPFGIGPSVSQGIISALGRQQPGLTTLTDFIQTDAAINPGNSGGPLINASGQVIGMNSGIFSASGNWQGIGFALPFAKVQMIASELATQGEIRRGYLGIDVSHQQTVTTITEDEAPGLEVIAVAPASPAANAGIRAGDILISINDMPLHDRTAAARLISSLMPGKTTSIELERDGQILRLTVVLTQK